MPRRREKPADPRAFDDLGSLQQEIMADVWSAGEATVKRVRDTLAAARRDLAYTTILSAMQKLERLGWLTHREEGRTYVYRAARSRKRESRHTLRRTLRQVFGGDRALLLQQLISESDVTREELVELRRLIQERRKEVTDV